MKIVIINPTYNERHNIETVITRVQAAVAAVPQHHVAQLIVDDHSPDGTSEVVRQLQPRYSNLVLLEKDHQGLGAAYVAGLRYAQEVLQAEAVVQMDADLQHNPNLLSQMIAAFEAGADVVIASRYIHGGGLPKNWGPFRRINSIVANRLARCVAELRSVHDVTSGYRIIRVPGVLAKIELTQTTVDGYAFLFQLLFQLRRIGASVVEVPMVFEERSFDQSKMGVNGRYLRDVSEYIKIVLTASRHKK